VQALDVVDNAAAGALVTIGSSAKACPAIASSPAAKVEHTTRGSISLPNIFYLPRVPKQQGRIGFSPKENVKLSNDELPDGLKKSSRNATKICHSIFLGVKAVLLSIRFRGYSSKTLQKNIKLKEK
jgi:hypothetical protein